jgi:uracil-DNA glycosylase family 4
MKNVYVGGEGSHAAKLMIVGEAPGAQEELNARPFCGPSGHMLDSILNEHGISRNSTYVTNVIKYRPPDNNFKHLDRIGVDYHQQVEVLWDEIRTIKPNAILALGNEALRALTGKKGIKEYRGSILRGKDGKTKVIPTIHPAAFLRQEGKNVFKYSALAYCKLDYKRAIDESYNSKLELPSRYLQIARSSHDVYKYIRQWDVINKWASDIESIKCIPSCISFAASPKHAISIPLLNNLLENPMSSYELATIWQMIDDILGRKDIVGQNFKYDQHKLSKPCGFPRVKLYADTAMQAHVLYPEFPKSQEFLASIWTREPFYKNEYREWDPRKDSYETVLSYNAKDSAVCLDIHEQLDKELIEEGLYEFYYDFFHHAHDLYLDIEDCGMPIDYRERAILKKKYKDRAQILQERLDQMAERHVNVNSPPQVKKFVFQFLELPERASVDENALVALMNNNIKGDANEWKRRAVKNILELRKCRKTDSVYIQAKPDFDGVMRTSYNIVGTENGRTSTTKVDTKKRINRPVFTGLPFQTLTKHGDTGADLRRMLVPFIGHTFLQMDLSQAEARVVAVLSDDGELIRKFELGIDVHSELAAAIDGREWNGQREPEDARFIGKTGRHSYNYGVKKTTFMLQVNTDADKFGLDLKLSEWKAGQILEAIRMRHPLVERVYHAEIERILNETRTLYNPFGRRRIFFDRWGHELIKEGLAFIPQSTVRDQMLKFMIQVRKDYPHIARKICVESHDALVFHCPNRMVDELSLYCKEWHNTNLIRFDKCSIKREYALRIPCDIEIGDNYKDLKKYVPQVKVA